jgi:DNA-binding NtrC family response regulator
LPPLRERGTDLEMLAEHFLDELNQTEGTNKRFAPAAIARLYEHAWPGNVRELKNYVQRAYILADSVIDDGGRPDTSPLAEEEDDLITVRVGTPLDEIERRVTMATLSRCGNVKKRAAKYSVSASRPSTTDLRRTHARIAPRANCAHQKKRTSLARSASRAQMPPGRGLSMPG